MYRRDDDDDDDDDAASRPACCLDVTIYLVLPKQYIYLALLKLFGFVLHIYTYSLPADKKIKSHPLYSSSNCYKNLLCI
jgi:hypothetical protein